MCPSTIASSRMMRILFVAACLPDPLLRGYEVRAFHQLRLLGRRHRITLLAYTDGAPRPAALARLRAFCAEIHTIPLNLAGMAAGITRGILSRRPLQTAIYDTPRMRSALHGLLRERRHDVVHVQMARMAALLDGAVDTPRVVDLIDALSVNMARRRVYDRGAARWLAGLEHGRLQRHERELCRTWDRALVASDVDRRAIGDFPNLLVNSNAVDLGHFASRCGGRTRDAIVFSGNLGYFPNVDGAVWFARDILPLIRAEVPGATLTIVGARPAREVRQLAALGAHVVVHGPVPDLAPHIARASVAVAPLRAGSGQSLKVLEAMACGTPIVATTRAVDGLAVKDGTHLLLADDAAAFARQVVLLLRDPHAAERIAVAARSLVESRYDWEASVAALDAIYASLAGPA
jgi:sugar transferase (PEP-CTERM/EpsH1 system associated)